jgi:hypothetical protein
MFQIWQQRDLPKTFFISDVSGEGKRWGCGLKWNTLLLTGVSSFHKWFKLSRDDTTSTNRHTLVYIPKTGADIHNHVPIQLIVDCDRTVNVFVFSLKRASFKR